MVTIKTIVRSGIRTHAHRSGLRPERSALDRSAILTTKLWRNILSYQVQVLHYSLRDVQNIYMLQLSTVHYEL